MPGFLVPALISGLGALGGLLGNRPSTSRQTQTTNTSGTQDTSGTFEGTQLPYLSDIQNILQSHLAAGHLNRLYEDPNLAGYTAGGLQNINRGSDIQRQIMNNILAQRGLSQSPTASYAAGSLQSNRIGQGIDFLNQIPLLRDQIMRQKLQDTGGFLQSLPYGTMSSGSQHGFTSTTGTSTGTGTYTYPGNMLGGLFGNPALILASLFGKGAFSGGGNPNTTTLSGIGGTGIGSFSPYRP